MNKQGIYIYGFVPNACVDNIKGLLLKTDIYAIEYKDIAAIVSDTSVVKIEYLNKEELARLLIDHQQNIEKLMSYGCTQIIPMQLGTIVSSGNDVIKILKNGLQILEKAFKIIDSVEEIDLAAVWSDFSSLITDISKMQDVMNFKNIIAHKSVYDEKDTIAIGKMIKDKIDQKNNKVYNDVYNSLMPFCVDSRKHETMNDEMPINSAFLVKKEDRNLFIDMIDQRNIKYADKLNFKIVGPLPCYSFYTLECKVLNKKDIEHAMRIIGIDSIKNDNDLKKAYRTKASLMHPDKNIDNSNIGTDSFIDINNAYKILLDYSTILKQAPESTNGELLYIVKFKD